MPIESADDLAAFFSPDEFGEAMSYKGVGGFSALHFHPGEPVPFASAHTPIDTHRFVIPVATLPSPEAGDAIAIEATGEQFSLTAEPYRSRDGALWILPAA